MFGRKKGEGALSVDKPGEPHFPRTTLPTVPKPSLDGAPSGDESAPAAAKPEFPRRVDTDVPTGIRAPASPLKSRASAADAKTLTVGRDICLNGEITACDTLVVEGRVEADLNGSRLIEIAEGGVVKGAAEIEEADVSGLFEGKLTVRGRLMIRSTGRVVGEIRYGKLEIKSGGQIAGEVETLATVADAAD